MKSLLIIRHAKSSWDPSILNDFDRPLNDRGQKNAHEMARRLLKKKVDISLFVASPAERAKTTAELFIQEFKRSKDEILFIPALYHAAPPVFFDVIAGLDDSFDSAAIFSHNPGITAFVNMITPVKLDNMPTCGVFACTINTNEWKTFAAGKKEFLFFDYPKSGLHD